MRYLVDSANCRAIEHMKEYYPIDGVTTNPSLIAKEKTQLLPLLKEIRQIIGSKAALHVQSVAGKAEDIVCEAERIADRVGGNLFIKIPVGEEGLKAVGLLKAKGIGTTVTAVFSSQQALLAARAGADFVAPYVNRLDNIGANGVQTVKEIAALFGTWQLPCQILAASFKNVRQISEISLAGAHCATVSPELLHALLSHPMTDQAVSGFDRDWQSVYGTAGIQELLS